MMPHAPGQIVQSNINRRLLLAVGKHRYVLISNEAAMATDRDLVVPRERLRIDEWQNWPDLLVQPDLFASGGPFTGPASDCDAEAIGRINPGDLYLVHLCMRREYADVPPHRRGLPLSHTSDPRWRLKEEELSELQRALGFPGN